MGHASVVPVRWPLLPGARVLLLPAVLPYAPKTSCGPRFAVVVILRGLAVGSGNSLGVALQDVGHTREERKWGEEGEGRGGGRRDGAGYRVLAVMHRWIQRRLSKNKSFPECMQYTGTMWRREQVGFCTVWCEPKTFGRHS